MATDRPTVSVCLPVYNGERFVGEAMRSILGQTLKDIELIISDNASTDRTGEICRDEAQRDPRIKYFRSDVNRGLAWNFNRAFELASGRYLVWMGHDDAMAPEYLERCVAELELHPEALLCFSNSYYTDDAGNITQKLELENTGAAEMPSDRFHRILYDPRCDPICGVMKVQYLKQTRLHPGYADSDRVLLTEMAMRGRFRKVEDYLFSRRMHPHQATATLDRWARSLIFDPRKAGKMVCPWWRELFDFIGAIHRAPISMAERLKCYKRLYWWVARYKGFLLLDVQRGLKLVRKT
jgi:glycosyltransferase involved in cell wall biosynthesis